MHLEIHDVVIVGGNGAGTAAAASLGKRLRKVLVCGAVEPAPSGGSGFSTVTELEADVEDIARRAGGFLIRTTDGNSYGARAVLFHPDSPALALGLPGARQFEGSSLHQCPYCDGWDHRNRKLGVLGSCGAGVDLALKLLRWSSQVTVFSHGAATDPGLVKRLERRRIRLRDSRVTALEGEGRELGGLRFQDDTFEACDALFFPAARKYHTSVAGRLGCDLERIPGALEWHPGDNASADGIFLLSGDGRKEADAIHVWLLEADRPSPAPPLYHQNGRAVVVSRQ